MSEFVWPPPENELDLTGALPAVPRTLKRRRHGASRRDERRQPSTRSQPQSFVWPPAELDLSAPGHAQEPEVAAGFSPGAVTLDRGPAAPALDRRALASGGPDRWRIALGPGTRRLATLAAAVVLALVIGGIWQTAGRWNTAPQPPRSSHSSVADPRPAAEEIEVAPPSPTPRRADRSPGERGGEPKEVANRTATEPEPDAPTTAAATRAAAPGADRERRDQPTTRLATPSPAEQPSEAVIASAAIGVGGAPSIASRRNPLELTPLVQPSLRASSSAPAPATPRPAAEPEPDAARPVPTAESTSESPPAESRAAPAIDEDHEAIEQLVARYQAAFDQRDASAAAAVWPSVERAALARAFADVQEQDLTLDRCDVAVDEGEATASCPGALSYVRRVGPSDPQVARHVWTFLLERHEEGWLIAEVTAR